jgi:lipopolysaccharide/colanic/teichoic acid biosynthesis glycosyltransferase
MNPVSSEAATLRTCFHSREQMLKRALDISGALLLLLVLSPVLLVLAVLILLSDGAPVIYRRRVVGPVGEFDAFKFRTMRRDADQMLQQDPLLQRTFSENFKLRFDPRVTGLGAVLRKFSLDELPQLYNVLCGQMSLVGPRMITSPELDKYGEYRDLLLRVKPGLTGYWQVHGRQEVSYAERVRMDIAYIQNWNLRMDLRLLWLTPARVIRGRGAY